MNKILLFGATGAIGAEVKQYFINKDWNVCSVTRNNDSPEHSSSLYFDIHDHSSYVNLATAARYDAVCWAQGKNLNDSVYNFDEKLNLETYEANCLFIISSLKYLLQNKLLANNAKLCVISSIWQIRSRQNKLSYTMSKAAVEGLVNSVALDIGKDGYLFNGVLPGVLDTPMTHKNLTPEQISQVSNTTFFNSLPKIKDVAALVYFLCSEENNSITGQSICVDLGFCNAKII